MFTTKIIRIMSVAMVFISLALILTYAVISKGNSFLGLGKSCYDLLLYQGPDLNDNGFAVYKCREIIKSHPTFEDWDMYALLVYFSVCTLFFLTVNLLPSLVRRVHNLARFNLTFAIGIFLFLFIYFNIYQSVLVWILVNN